MYLIIQLSLLFVCFVGLLSLIGNKTVKFILLAIFTIFITAEFNSVIIGGTLIDYKFYQHLNFETIWAVKSVFLVQAFKVIIFCCIIGYIFYFVASNKYVLKVHYGIKAVLICATLCLMSLKGGLIYNIYEIFKLKNATVNTNFEQSLSSLGSNNNKYVSSDDVKVEQISDSNATTTPQNIIVISMESFEKGYLSDNLAHLTPNLRKFAKENTFFNMPMGTGSEWTAGSIYTELTGFPCLFKNQGNAIFQGATDTKISGVGSILKKAGYDLTYALASADFAGIRDMLLINKFDVKTDGDFSSKNVFLDWGTSDKDLFNEVKKIIKSKKKNVSKKPFAVFMSTICTHPPDGVYDSRMEKIIKKQKTNLEFMAAATDYYIADLISFLKKENLYDNTVIYLFPDHLLMGTESSVVNRFPNPRSLFLLTNAPSNRFTYNTSKDIYQIDIPKIILEGAQVKHNAKFFTDLINGKNKLQYINDHKSEILAINESSLIFEYKHFGVNSVLKKGLRLYSPNKRFSFILNKDGNGVIYDNLVKSIWSTGTHDKPVSKMILDNTGDLKLIDDKNNIYWSTKTSGGNNTYLILQDDGNLVIYSGDKALWASNSVQ